MLHHRLDVTRRVPERAPGEPSTTRLVAREASLVREENPRARVREADRRRRACGACADDEHVYLLHVPIVGVARGHGYNCPPRRGSRVAKGGGL